MKRFHFTVKISSHLLKQSITENFIFCAVQYQHLSIAVFDCLTTVFILSLIAVVIIFNVFIRYCL